MKTFIESANVIYKSGVDAIFQEQAAGGDGLEMASALYSFAVFLERVSFLVLTREIARKKKGGLASCSKVKVGASSQSGEHVIALNEVPDSLRRRSATQAERAWFAALQRRNDQPSGQKASNFR